MIKLFKLNKKLRDKPPLKNTDAASNEEYPMCELCACCGWDRTTQTETDVLHATVIQYWDGFSHPSLLDERKSGIFILFVGRVALQLLSFFQAVLLPLGADMVR